MIATYLIGRMLYFRAYVTYPKKRTLSFAVSILPIIALLLAAAAGAIRDMIQTGF
jgi:hypothetical protein